MSDPDVGFYEVSAMTHLGITSRIERQEEWAIVHDRFDDTWEVWAAGELYDVSDSPATARQKLREATDERLRSGEFRYKR